MLNKADASNKNKIVSYRILSAECVENVFKAVKVIREGGVIAYPTEYCFGLGCDPRDLSAVKRIIEIKQRNPNQGLILLAANIEQVTEYACLDSLSLKTQILETWPGPVTWTLPARQGTSEWLRGKHSSIALRITAHQISASICAEFDHAIVSTSANVHAKPALLNATDVIAEMGKYIDYVMPESVGGTEKPSQIRDGLSGEILR